jgi:hypothetical protein
MRLNTHRMLPLLLLTCGLLPAQTAYFPPETLGETPESSDFVLHWYSKHLRAMNEPSLLAQSKDPKAHTYRFLWLRTFHHPVSVRVEINSDGSAEVFTKVLSGAGGYEPGKLIKNTKKHLSKDYVEHVLLEMINTARFWTLPTRENSDLNLIHLDGAQWVMEGVKDGKYHVVDRWSPKCGEYKAVCTRFLINLGGLKLLYEDVY